MRIKTMVILLVAVLLAIVIFQNTGQVKFTFLFADMYISKLAMLLLVAAIAFGLGVMVGRPKNVRRLGGGFTDGSNPNTLSDEDREYVR
jgi:uncharacterized integral membrane protein